VTHGAQARVLVVDDEPTLLTMLGRMLTAWGYAAVTARDGQEALRLLATERFDAVVSDITMPGMDGLEMLAAVRSHDMDLPVILITGYPSLETAMRAIEHGAFQYLRKPVKFAELREVLANAVNLGRMARLKREAMELIAGQGGLPGDRAGLEANFDAALSTLEVHYQPIVYPDGAIFAYEALMRPHGDGLDTPATMLEAAERLHRLADLGHAVRSQAAAALEARGEGTLLFVNLHPEDLLDPALLSPANDLAELAGRVVLEITERASLEGVSDIRARVGQLRARGYRIAIDDLGSGYAGLASFAALQPDFVKIDMALVRGVDADPVRRRLIASIADLCHGMGIHVIAEGIETRAEREATVEAGCDLLQGFLFAKAGPLPEAPSGGS